MLTDLDAYSLAREFHLECRRVKVAYYLADQLGRASSSVALNIAEGSGKRTVADQARYYSNALGSLRECYAISDIEELLSPKLKGFIDRLGAMLYKLSRPKKIKGQKEET